MNQNLVSIIGHLGKDPEVTFTTAGDAVCNFSLAVSRYVKKDDGDFNQITTWINFTAWKHYAERMGQVGQKGAEISVTGELREKKWDDKDGVTQYRTFVHCNKVDFGEGRIIKARDEEVAKSAPDKPQADAGPETPAPPVAGSSSAGKPAVAEVNTASQAASQPAAVPVTAEDEDDLPF